MIFYVDNKVYSFDDIISILENDNIILIEFYKTPTEIDYVVVDKK